MATVTLRPRVCCECGSSFQPQRRTAEFCGDKCRFAFDRRRKSRGADLYDLVLLNEIQRNDRDGVRSLISRLVQQWREEDRAERDGRPSYCTDKAELFARHASARATVVNRNAAGVKRT
jgi:hypothetical protein